MLYILISKISMIEWAKKNKTKAHDTSIISNYLCTKKTP